MDVVITVNNVPVNDMLVLMNRFINDLHKIINTKSRQSLFGQRFQFIFKANIHVSSNTSMSWKVIYAVKMVWQQFDVSKIVLSVGWT